MSNFEKIPKGTFDKIESNKQLFIEEFKDKLQDVFPTVIKDGMVDFEALLNEFGKYVETDEKEKYNMTWVGKKEAIRKANEDIVGKTLKYVPEDSKNPDTTQNLYIEGDNLEVLKLLRNSYYGKVKMIYIDPPYNRGEDLIYQDDYTMSKKEYETLAKNVNESGERMIVNTKNDGRFHSRWLNMMYPKIKVAKDLLSDDGFIFISIDENEIENLTKICNEIYGEENHLNTIAIKMSEATGVKMTHASKRLPKLKEYVLIYSKRNIDVVINKISTPKDQWDSEYKHVIYGVNKSELDYIKNIMEDENIASDEEIRKADEICSKIKLQPINQLYEEYNVTTEEEKLNIRYSNAWRIVRDVATTGSAKKRADEKKKLTNSGFFLITTSQNKKYLIKSNYSDSASQPRIKILFADKYLTVNPGDFWQDIKTTGLDNEGGVPYKNGKKPLKMLERLIALATNKNSIVLDFFSGSASTAHAVINRNNKDGGNRKFIMVQIDENLDNSYEKATGENKKTIKETIKFLDSINKPHILSELGKERIRQAGDRILEKNKGKEGIENLDAGFKVFRVADTNIRWISDTLGKNMKIEDHRGGLSIKDQLDFNPNFTDIDVVYEMMLKRQDIELTEQIDKLDEIGDRTYLVGYTVLVCLEEEITEEIVSKISKIETSLSWIIFRDSAFEDDINLKTNTMNLLRRLLKEKNPKNKNQKILWI